MNGWGTGSTSPPPWWVVAGLILGSSALLGCTEERVAPLVMPVVDQVRAEPGPHNAVSAVIRAEISAADSAVIRYGLAGAALDSLTPTFDGLPDSGTVAFPLLGLLPESSYLLQVVAFGHGAAVTSERISFTTGPLPADLPAYAAGGTDPTPGYVVFGAYPYGVVIDNTGRVVWYRHLDWGTTLNFQVQPTGRYTTSPIAPAAGDMMPWVELDPLGNETRRLGCADGLVSRFHDLIAEADGSYWLMCDETRQMNLVALGGQPAAEVTGTVVQHVDAGGARLFSWSAFDHFAITDLDSASRAGPAVNWTHGNAITLDGAGHLLVSFRSLSEITKIDLATGAVLWRFGGLANKFTVSGTGAPFVGQHGLRLAGPHALLMLDNRGVSAGSRGEQYALDEANRLAQLTATYSAGPPVIATLGGSTQPLPRGHLLVAYGNGNRVQEYDAGGSVVWEIHGNPGYVFRAQRIASLYNPGGTRLR